MAPTGRTSNCRTSQFHTPLTEDPVLTAGARTRKALGCKGLWKGTIWPQAPERTGPRSAAVLVRRMRASTKSCCIRASTQPKCNNPPQHEIVMPQRDVTQRRPRLPPRGAGRADGNACARGCGFAPSSPRVGVAAFAGAAPNSLFDDRATFVFAPPRPCAGPRPLPSDLPSDAPSD